MRVVDTTPILKINGFRRGTPPFHSSGLVHSAELTPSPRARSVAPGDGARVARAAGSRGAARRASGCWTGSEAIQDEHQQRAGMRDQRWPSTSTRQGRIRRRGVAGHAGRSLSCSAKARSRRRRGRRPGGRRPRRRQSQHGQARSGREPPAATQLDKDAAGSPVESVRAEYDPGPMVALEHRAEGGLRGDNASLAETARRYRRGRARGAGDGTALRRVDRRSRQVPWRGSAILRPATRSPSPATTPGSASITRDATRTASPSGSSIAAAASTAPARSCSAARRRT